MVVTGFFAQCYSSLHDTSQEMHDGTIEHVTMNSGHVYIQNAIQIGNEK